MTCGCEELPRSALHGHTSWGDDRKRRIDKRGQMTGTPGAIRRRSGLSRPGGAPGDQAGTHAGGLRSLREAAGSLRSMPAGTAPPCRDYLPRPWAARSGGNASATMLQCPDLSLTRTSARHCTTKDPAVLTKVCAVLRSPRASRPDRPERLHAQLPLRCRLMRRGDGRYV